MRRSFRTVLALIGLVGLAGLVSLALPRPRAFAERNLRRLVRAVAARFETARPSARASTPKPLTAWVVGDSTKVFPGDLLRPPSGPGASVELQGARGETLAFQVVLAAQAGRTGVTLDIGDLQGSTQRIPSQSIDAFVASFIRCPSTTSAGPSLGPGEHPDALIPIFDGPERRPLAHPFAVAPERNQPVWVDVSIPRQAEAGRYHGELRFASEKGEVVRVALSLEVYNFEIPRTPSLTAWVPLYSGHLSKGEGVAVGDEEKSRDVLWAYYRMAQEHRFVTQVAEEQPRITWDDATGQLLSADWATYDARNGPALDGSLFEDGEPPALWKVGGFMGWGKGFGGSLEDDPDITPARRRALREYALEIERHFRERGFTRPRLFMYLIDEPDFEDHPNAARVVKAYGDAIHAAGTSIRHLVTVAPQQSPLLEDAVDIWAMLGSVYYPRLMAARQKAGDLAWFYQQREPFVGGHHVNDEALGLRSWAWIAWRYRVDGIFLWVGNFWNSDPYRDAKTWDDAQLGNGVLFYPGHRLADVGHPPRTGPVSSIRMKCLRRGLFDYEYFRLLRDLGGDPDPLVSSIVRSALNEGEWDPVWHHPRWKDHGAWSHVPDAWDGVRKAVAQKILERLRPL